MKKYDIVFAVVTEVYCFLAVVSFLFLYGRKEEYGRQYLVEVNEIMRSLKEAGGFYDPKLRDKAAVTRVSYIDREEMEELSKAEEFFRKQNGTDRHVEPLFVEGELIGFVGFDYVRTVSYGRFLLLAEGIILACGILLVGVLLYVRNKILKPFGELCEMPYELAKGRLGYEIKENKSRFFGRFVWGLSMLRDNLKAAKAQELKLEKEKKLLLLSLSHDIKTPLHTIKLYARALEEGIYDTEDKKDQAAGQIQVLAGEIESFVKDIVKTSSQDILHIEVEDSEFYLEEYIELTVKFYEPKCRLLMVDLHIGGYDNKLIKGNRDSAFGVMENIMENAFKYGDGKRIDITFSEEEYCQLIKIRNTGSVVNVQEMPHLFDSFFRGSNVESREGNGLGLYICRETMRKMEGDIFAEREEDGMSFTLVFR